MTEQSIGALALKIVDPWAWWRGALANPSDIGKILPVHDGDPQQGYYRVRYGKDKPFEPVAIWKDEGGKWLAYRAGREVDAEGIWTSCCRHPVTYEAYNAAIEGRGWPDDDNVVSSQVSPSIGDNSGSVDETETLKDQIGSALEGVKSYEKIVDDATAAKALSLRNRLNELSGQAEKIRVKEKEPHLEAGKAVDAKWQPLVKSAKAGADKVRDAIGAWETEKLQAERKRQAEIAAEQARISAEQAAREQPSDGDVMEAPAPAHPAETAPSSIRPTYGKAASVQVKTVVKDVTDWSALAVYMSLHPEVQDLLRKLAHRALDAGRTDVPGITIEEKAQVR